MNYTKSSQPQKVRPAWKEATSQKLDLKSFKINGSEFGALFLDGKLQGCIGINEDDKGLSYIPCLFCSLSLCEMKKMFA